MASATAALTAIGAHGARTPPRHCRRDSCRLWQPQPPRNRFAGVVPHLGRHPPRPQARQTMDVPAQSGHRLVVLAGTQPHFAAALGRGRHYRAVELSAVPHHRPPHCRLGGGQPRPSQNLRTRPRLWPMAGAHRAAVFCCRRAGDYRRRCRCGRRLQRPALRPSAVYRLHRRGAAGDARRRRQPHPGNAGAGRKIAHADFRRCRFR